MNHRLPRRQWMQTVAATSASLIILRDSRSAHGYFANEKLGVALVGLSGAVHGLSRRCRALVKKWWRCAT